MEARIRPRMHTELNVKFGVGGQVFNEGQPAALLCFLRRRTSLGSVTEGQNDTGGFSTTPSECEKASHLRLPCSSACYISFLTLGRGDAVSGTDSPFSGGKKPPIASMPSIRSLLVLALIRAFALFQLSLAQNTKCSNNNQPRRVLVLGSMRSGLFCLAVLLLLRRHA